MRSPFSSVTVLASLLLAACAHETPIAAKPLVGPSPAAVAPQPAPAPVVAEQTCSKDDDCDAKALCIRDRCVPITAEVELAECSHVRVHFAFDAWLLEPDEEPKLDRLARCLRVDQKLHVTIEGNADERGTEEYNLQLGARRAIQVQKYLEALGVADSRLATISYGFERPLCTSHDEACWSENRRAGVKAAAVSSSR